MKWLEQIVELAAEKNVPLIFIAAPYCINSEEQMNFNAIEEYAKIIMFRLLILIIFMMKLG